MFFLVINYELILIIGLIEVLWKGEFLLKLKYCKICFVIWFWVILFCFGELVLKECYCFFDWIFFWLNIICKNIISMISRNNYNVIMLKDNIIYLYD